MDIHLNNRTVVDKYSELIPDSISRSTERIQHVISSSEMIQITADCNGHRTVQAVPNKDQDVRSQEYKNVLKSNNPGNSEAYHAIVTTTHVISPSKFYVRLEYQDALFESLQHLLNASELQSAVDTGVQPGVVYGIKNIGSEWKRGKCLSACGVIVLNEIREPCFNFFLIDEGCEKQVPVSCVRILPDHLVEYPPLATECQLSLQPPNGKWSIGNLRLFQQLVSKKYLKMTVFAAIGEKLAVDLCQIPSFPGEPSLKSVQEALCVDYPQSDVTLPPRKFTVLFSGIKSGTKLDGQISYVANLHKIYIRFDHDNHHEFSKMHEEIQAQLNTLNGDPSLTVHLPRIGQPYAACRAYVWYRVLVEEITKNEARVFCVDTGHFERVSFKDLRHLNDKFLSIPARITRCALSNFRLSEESKEACYQFLREKLRPASLCRVTVNGNRSGSIGEVDGPEFTLFVSLFLLSEMQSINSQLVEKGFAKDIVDVQPEKCGSVIGSALKIQRTPPSPMSTLRKPVKSVTNSTQPMEKSCVTTPVTKMPSSNHVESSTGVRFTHQLDEKLKDQKLIGRVVLTSNPYYFYIQSDDQGIESLDAQLQIELNSSDAEVSLAIPSPRLGDACAVRFDGMWRRALVETISDRVRIGVFLVDSGQRIPVLCSDLRRLKDSYMKQATRVSLCRLTAVRSIAEGNNWPENSIYFFINKVLNAEVSAFVEHVLPGTVGRTTSSKEMVACVIMYVGNEEDSVNTQLVRNGFATCVGYLEKPVHRAYQQVVAVESISGVGVIDETVEVLGRMPTASDYVVAVKFLSCLSSDAIYVRPLAYREKYQKMVKDMQKFYSTCQTGKIKQIVVGLRCAALVDGRWIRALVVDIFESVVCSIVNVDTGQTHKVFVRHTLPLQEDFASVPDLAIRCTLAGLEKLSVPSGVIPIISALMSADEIFIICPQRPNSLSSNLTVDIIYRCIGKSSRDKVINLKDSMMKSMY